MNSSLENPQMGKFQTRYENNPAYARDLVGFIILFVLAGLAGVIAGLMQDRLYDKLAIMGIGLLSLAVGGRIYVAFRGRLKASVEVYEDGFVFTDRRGRRMPYRWDDVSEVYEMITYRDSSRRRHPRWWTYTVYRSDGQRAKLDNAIKDARSLGATVQQQVGKRLLPRAFEAYKQGESVSFGPKIGLRQKGLVLGEDILPWEDVERIRFTSLKSVEIHRKDKRGAWKTVFHPKIANYPTFKALLRQAIEFNPPSAQPDVDDPELHFNPLSSPTIPRSNIGETSARLGFDVRELLREGYTMKDVQGILDGEYDVHELRKRKPGKGRGRN